MCLCFQLLCFTLQEPLLAASWQKEVTCSHMVALLAWLCPTRVPTACPGKGPEHSPVLWHLTESQNSGPLQLVGESDRSGSPSAPPCRFWGRERCWVTPALKTLCGESSPAHPSLAQAVTGPNTCCCSSFLYLSSPPDPSCFSSEPLFPNINSLQHL